jgi:hypothetical protein
MRNYWIVPGTEENWRQAFISKGIWGLEDTTLDKVYWLAIVPNDVILFYVSGKVKGIVGYGIVRSKFYQDVPLWNAELQSNRVRWPLRFEFDVEFLLPEDRWKHEKTSVPRGALFRQPLIIKKWVEIEPIIQALNPSVSKRMLEEISIPQSVVKLEVVSTTHEDIKNLLLV